MMHRYFQVEPLYSDLDTFCNITVVTGRVRANIQIYADEWMLAEVAAALKSSVLDDEHPKFEDEEFDCFQFRMSVMPHKEGKIVRFKIYQGMTEDGAPFLAEIRFIVSHDEVHEFGNRNIQVGQ
ncbi:MAG: hypothetical protein MZV65_32495 [Chromatiales bacterium]|nr:hypothetical protein [Chromatiales bacterium]